MTHPEAMGVELLPCPFCGAQANSHQVSARSVRFVCPNCEASGPIADGNPEQEQVWSDARSAWNRRTAPAVDGLEVVAWQIRADWSETRYVFAAESEIDGSIPLVRLSDAQALSTQVQRLTAERDSWRRVAERLEGEKQAALEGSQSK